MKLFLSFLIALLFVQITLAQTQTQAYKLAEYDRVGVGCTEFFRMLDFTEEISKQNGNRGLIVIYSGDKRERFGNVLSHISGTKEYLNSWMKFPSEKVIYVIAEGKKLFDKELWIIPEGAKLPDFESASFDWDNLKTKYLYSETCFQCEPSYPLLTTFQSGFDEYVNILKKHPEYTGLLTVNNFEDLFYAKSLLMKEYKLSKNRFTIQFAKKIKGDEYSIAVNLYIVPKEIK